jgi:hypothetical protein
MAQTSSVLRVGKHKGRSFEDAEADRGYCAWILREQGLSQSLQKFRKFLVTQHSGIVTVGKHRLKFFDEVSTQDPGYCAWVLSLEDANFFQAFQQYLKGDPDNKVEEEIVEPPKKKQKETKAPKDTCKICYDKAISCVFIPCGHLVCCLRCGNKCERMSGDCPICKEGIALVTQTFTA